MGGGRVPELRCSSPPPLSLFVRQVRNKVIKPRSAVPCKCKHCRPYNVNSLTIKIQPKTVIKGLYVQRRLFDASELDLTDTLNILCTTQKPDIYRCIYSNPETRHIPLHLLQPWQAWFAFYADFHISFRTVKLKTSGKNCHMLIQLFNHNHPGPYAHRTACIWYKQWCTLGGARGVPSL